MELYSTYTPQLYVVLLKKEIVWSCYDFSHDALCYGNTLLFLVSLDLQCLLRKTQNTFLDPAVEVVI